MNFSKIFLEKNYQVCVVFRVQFVPKNGVSTRFSPFHCTSGHPDATKSPKQPTSQKSPESHGIIENTICLNNVRFPV
jgi:hypothetical protein